MMKQENQIIIISGFLGFAIGVFAMMMVISHKVPTINYCCNGEIQEIENLVCEECWYNVFDGGNEYQFTD